MVELVWNVNQPGRWRRPALVAKLREGDTDWKRFLINRPADQWDPRKYLEYRLFWPYSSGMPGQWMCHQIDTVHWFTGLTHPRSVVANGGIYQWKDGRKNWDTMTAVFDYGNEKAANGFQVVFMSRMHNSSGGVGEVYYSNGGELNLITNKISPKGGLTQVEAAEMGMECIRNRKQPNAPVEAGYNHSVASIMTNAAIRTGQKATFDEKSQEVMAGGKVFRY
jgi:predicted dehydrogenase